MKIKVKEVPYEEILKYPVKARKKPLKQRLFWRLLMRMLSFPELFFTKFSYQEIGMEKLDKDQPCLFLMNHSSFIDLEIAATILWNRPFNVVCTSDAFIGKSWLMRWIGCIPTKKFVADVMLIKDMVYTVKTLKSSVLMFPEAGYTFDGTATVLPDSMGKCLKMMKVPVVMICTYGAFARNPLYNNLQNRKVKISADVKYILSPEEIASKSVEELNEILAKHFSFDNFRWQQENQIAIKETFRADSLNRVLYKCPHCKTEGKMVGKGTTLTCGSCGKEYELTEYGFMKAVKGDTEFEHIPDWYRWERECVRKELQNGTYGLDIEVDIYMIVDTKCLYKVGTGRLRHTTDGFTLTGCDGKLNYVQKPSFSYSLNSDYYWYEIGDMISIGNMDNIYYCFPKESGDVVAKTRLATEELYKLVKSGELK